MTEIKMNGIGKAKFPWRVSRCQKDFHPTVVDADDQVVAWLVNGSIEDAERIVKRCNAAAELCYLEEV